MIEADRHLKLLSPSIWDMYKVFEHIDMLFQGIQLQPYTVIPILLGSDFGDLGHMSSRKDAITSWLRPTATSNHFPHPYQTYMKCLRTLICCFKAYSCSLIQLYPSYLAQNCGIWVTCPAETMPWRHGWDRKPPQTTSPIHIKHIQSVQAHWYAVSRHTVAALYSYTHPTWLRFWGFGSHVKSKRCHYVIVQAESHLKPLPPYILVYKKCLSTLICCFKAYSCSLIQLYPPYLAQILGFWVTCQVKKMPLRHDWGGTAISNLSPHPYWYIQSVWSHWYAVQWQTVAALYSYALPTWLRF